MKIKQNGVGARQINRALASIIDASHREKEIMANVEEIEVRDLSNGYIVAEIYDLKGNGFQIIVEGPGRKPGEITN